MASASDTRPSEVPRPARSAGLRGRLKEIPRPLALILLAGAVLSLAWAVSSPSLEGPDEAKHFAYVQYLAETGHLPRVATEAEPEVAPGSTEEQVTVNSLLLRPAITNRRVRPAWSSADLSVLHQAERTMPRGSRGNGADGNPLAKNPPLYYALMTIPYRVFVWLPLLKRVFLMRLFNMLFYLATIVFAWLIAGELFGPVRWKQSLTAGVVAFEPQMPFLAVTINPDNLLIALTTGFLLASIRLIKRGPSLWRVLAASLFAAAASLTHGRGLVTLPVLAVVLVVAWIRHRPSARGTLLLGAAGIAPVGAAFLFYALFGKASGTGSLYGGQLKELNSTHRSFKVGQFLSTIWNFYFEPIVKTPKAIGPKWGWRQVFVEGFYGGFGSGNLTLPKGVVAALRVLTLLSIAGFIAAVVACWRQVRRASPYVLVGLSLLVTSLVFLHYVNYRAVLNRGTGHLFIGRYLLEMIALFGVAITFTAGSLPRRQGPLFGAAILAFGVLLCFTGLLVSDFRFYG
jgi:4-amino-4-deoxy-L-arabinose transferase-like glycosyltransferase